MFSMVAREVTMIKCILCSQMHSMEDGLICAACKRKNASCMCVDPIHPGDNENCPIHGKAVQ